MSLIFQNNYFQKKFWLCFFLITLIAFQHTAITFAHEGSPDIEPGLQDRNDIIFFEDFEDENWRDRNTTTSRDNWWITVGDGAEVERVEGGHVFDGDASLRTYLSVNGAQSSLKYYFNTVRNGENHLTDAYMRWYEKIEDGVYFETDQRNYDHIIIKGNSLYGWPLGDEIPGQLDPQSPRMAFRAATTAYIDQPGAGPYVYYYGQDDHCEDDDPDYCVCGGEHNYCVLRDRHRRSGALTHVPNQWVCIEIRLKGNDIGYSNGRLSLWFNNQEIYNIGNKVLRMREDTVIQAIWNMVRLSIGGGNSGDITRWFDNIVVAENRIGCMDEPAPSSAPSSSPIPTSSPTPSSFPTSPPSSCTPPCHFGNALRANGTCDNDINMSDYATWFREFFNNETTLYADFNRDNVVNRDDLPQWINKCYETGYGCAL